MGRLVGFRLRGYAAELKYFIPLLLLPLLLIPVIEPIRAFVRGERSPGSFEISVVDGSESGTVGMALSLVLKSASLGQNITVRTDTEEEARKRIQNNETAAAILIPQDFVSAVEEGKPNPITVLVNQNQPLAAGLLRSGLNSAGEMMGDVQNVLYMLSKYTGSLPEARSIFDESMMTLILTALGRDALYQTETLLPFGNTNPLSYYGTTVLLVFLCVVSLYPMIRETPEEQDARRIRESLSKTKHWQFAAGEGTAFGLFLFLLALPAASLLLFLSDLSPMGPFWPVLLLICLGMGCIGSLMGRCFPKNGKWLLSGFYGISLLLSGVILPPAFLGLGQWTAKATLPRHWSRCLLATDAASLLKENTGSLLLLCLLPPLCTLIMGRPFQTSPKRPGGSRNTKGGNRNDA